MLKDAFRVTAERYFEGHPDKLGLASEVVLGLTPTIVEYRPEHLQQVLQWMDDGNSLIAYFAPHTTALDPMYFSKYVLREMLSPGKPYEKGPRPVKWIGSSRLLGGFEWLGDMGLETKGQIEFQRRMGFEEPFPVIQPRHLKSESGRTSEQIRQAQDLNLASLLAARGFLVETDGGILAISSEGTRRQTGGLCRAANGIDFLFKRSKKQVAGSALREVAVLPVIMEGFHRIQAAEKHGFDGLNPVCRTKIRIGQMVGADYLRELANKYEWDDVMIKSYIEEEVTDADMKTRDRLIEQLIEQFCGIPEEFLRGGSFSSMGRFGISDAMMLHLIDQGLTPWLDGVDPRGVYSPEFITEKV